MSRVSCNTRKRTQDTYREREGACPGVSGFAPQHPAGWICARYKSSVLLLLLLLQNDVSPCLTIPVVCQCDNMGIVVLFISTKNDKLVRVWSWLRDRIFFSDPWVATAVLSIACNLQLQV